MKKNQATQIRTDGSNRDLSTEEIDALKNVLTDIRSNWQKEDSLRLQNSNNIRFCIWSGQNETGKKLQKYMPEQTKVFPFEGATDSRFRLSDGIIQELLDIIKPAAMSGKATVSSAEINDGPLSRHMETILKWARKSDRGYMDTIEKTIQWMLGDTPAISFIRTGWREEITMQPEEYTLGRLASELLEEFNFEELGPEPEMEDGPDEYQMWLDAAMQYAMAYLMDPGNDPIIFEQLEDLMPHLDSSTIRKFIRDLRENDAATIPAPTLSNGRPFTKALRNNHDIFVSNDTDDLHDAESIFIREWVTESVLNIRIISQGYDRTAVKSALETKGKSYFDTSDDRVDRGGVEPGDGTRSNLLDGKKEMVEIVTAYFSATGNNGIVGKYQADLCLAGSTGIALTPATLLPYSHGQYPIIPFSRERLTSRLTDSRGIPLLAVADQSIGKALTDCCTDNAFIEALPPIEVPMSRPDIRVTIAPLAQNKVGRSGEIAFMKGPESPKSAFEILDRNDQRICRYFGLKHPAVDPEVTYNRQQSIVNRFLYGIAQVHTQLLQLCQQHMTDEMVARITGGQPQFARTKQEIQGLFDIEIEWNVRAGDLEYVKSIVSLFNEAIAPLDTEAVINRAALVEYIMRLLDPNLAERVIVPVETANQAEIEDEQKNIALIMSGIEPPMKDRGQNATARLQQLNQWAEQNPDLLNTLGERQRQILENRAKNLNLQVSQAENRIIGRFGATPVQ